MFRLNLDGKYLIKKTTIRLSHYDENVSFEINLKFKHNSVKNDDIILINQIRISNQNQPKSITFLKRQVINIYFLIHCLFLLSLVKHHIFRFFFPFRNVTILGQFYNRPAIQ